MEGGRKSAPTSGKPFQGTINSKGAQTFWNEWASVGGYALRKAKEISRKGCGNRSCSRCRRSHGLNLVSKCAQ